MIDRARLETSLAAEERRFVTTHPRSHALFERATRSLLAGVPMPWMMRWPGGFPVFVEEGRGAHFVDADGHVYLDLCLGDTGAMTGHAPPPTVAAVAEQAQRGITFMLPGEDAIWVAEELARRFGLPFWQFTLSASDANRFAIRLARLITGRPKVLVFNWCYHGTVDEALVTLGPDGPAPRPGNVGPAIDPAVTTRVVEFNDVPALEHALAGRDVACVLAEPAMTNIGIILANPGFHDALRTLTRRSGTLLILDETHTICAGPGGYTATHELTPDMLTLGKPVGSGVPSGAYGLSDDVARRVQARIRADESDTGGIGGTLAGNALSLAAMRATLEHVMTGEAYAHMEALAARLEAGLGGVVRQYELPWHVVRVGARVEFICAPGPLRNGTEAEAAHAPALEQAIHLALLNRGCLIAPFHNMMLVSPATTGAQVEALVDAFEGVTASLALPLDDWQ
jgi:glutamate-1-semialdehyde 2,1-aminomutase